jgi:effector-binding domain-containing protein
MTVFGVREKCAMEEMGPAMDRVFSAAKSGLSADGLAAEGKMVSVYHSVDLKQGRFDFTGGFTIQAADAKRVADLDRCDVPATRALHLRHTGSYDHLGNAWSGAYQYARHKKLKVAKVDSYEIYRNDPDATPESELVTDIYVPIR